MDFLSPFEAHRNYFKNFWTKLFNPYKRIFKYNNRKCNPIMYI
nr:MAG TPA: hypothetical protein [Caudoviricetes sp.]